MGRNSATPCTSPSRKAFRYDTFRTGGADVLTSYGNYICQTKPVYPFDGRVLQWGFGQERARTRHMSAIQLWLGESGD